MRKNALPGMLVLVLLVAPAVIAAVEDPDGDRTASFIGATIIDHELNQSCAEVIDEPECITPIPTGLAIVTCDGEGNPYTGGLYDGVGGVLFCEIPRGSLIELEFSSLLIDLKPEGRITCTYWQQFPSYHEIGRLTDEGPVQIRLPDICGWDSGEDGSEEQEYTEILVFMEAASLAKPDAYLNVEGEVTLRIRDEGS